MRAKAGHGQQQRVGGDLVVDDAPGVRHSGVILPGKGMVADTRGAKGIAGYIQWAQTGAVPLDVKSSQGS